MYETPAYLWRNNPGGTNTSASQSAGEINKENSLLQEILFLSYSFQVCFLHQAGEHNQHYLHLCIFNCTLKSSKRMQNQWLILCVCQGLSVTFCCKSWESMICFQRCGSALQCGWAASPESQWCQWQYTPAGTLCGTTLVDQSPTISSVNLFIVLKTTVTTDSSNQRHTEHAGERLFRLRKLLHETSLQESTQLSPKEEGPSVSAAHKFGYKPTQSLWQAFKSIFCTQAVSGEQWQSNWAPCLHSSLLPLKPFACSFPASLWVTNL